MKVQLCTFTLGELYLAVPVGEVQEVIREERLTRVPLAPPTVRGLMNLRGQIVTTIDLRACLGLPAPETPSCMHVVLRRESNAASLLVDDIGDVIEVEEETSTSPPKTLTGALRDLLANVYKLRGQLLLVLDSTQVSNRVLAAVAS